MDQINHLATSQKIINLITFPYLKYKVKVRGFMYFKQLGLYYDWVIKAAVGFNSLKLIVCLRLYWVINQEPVNAVYSFLNLDSLYYN